MSKQITSAREQGETQILVGIAKQFAALIALPDLEAKAMVVFEASPVWLKIGFLVGVLIWNRAHQKQQSA